MQTTWMKPELTEISVNAECTAYSDTLPEEVI